MSTIAQTTQDQVPEKITYLDPKDQQNFSVAMHIGFGDMTQNRYMKVATCIALYTVLLLIWMPGISFGERVYTVQPEERVVMRRKVLRPPVEQPKEMMAMRSQKARKTPMPDLTPEEPEPAIAAIEMAPLSNEIKMLETDMWEGGIPDGPPRSKEIAVVGAPGVDAPVFTLKVPPSYPIKGVEVRLQGYVILQAILRKDGTVDDVEVLRGLGRGKFGFEKAAINSLRRWEFIPGMVNGEPADVRMNLRVDFVLN